jgi:hypothetical protein
MSIHVADKLAGSTSARQAWLARVASEDRGRPSAPGERAGSSEPAVEVGAEASGLVVAILGWWRGTWTSRQREEEGARWLAGAEAGWRVGWTPAYKTSGGR